MTDHVALQIPTGVYPILNTLSRKPSTTDLQPKLHTLQPETRILPSSCTLSALGRSGRQALTQLT